MKLAVYNCNHCGRMMIGKAGPKQTKGKSCPTCHHPFERNDEATAMLEDKYKE